MSNSNRRDAEMDRLLRTVLKPAPREQAGACPDASLLAAFVEGGLTATERTALDAHFAGCGRCQEALAVLSDDVAEAEAQTVPAPESGWFTWVTRPRLKWLVPISAVATVAVVFLATRPLIAPDWGTQRAEVAQMAQAPAEPAPSAELDTLSDRTVPVPEKREASGAGGGDESPKALVGRPKAFASAPGATAGTPPSPPAGGKTVAEPAAGMMAARMSSEVKPAPPAAPTATPPPAAGGQPAVAQQAANAPAAAAEARKQAVSESDRAVPAAAARKDAQSLETGLLSVSAPGGSVIWRFGTGGRLSRSGDAGATWHEQASGVTADLLAGAAPSPATCWIVGAAGTILVTTDGERWERRPFPEAVDLVSVSASGSRTAVVTARDGRRFETNDAGHTWSTKQ